MPREIRRDDRPGLYCVELRTSDWDRSLAWYRETLGLRVLVRVSDDGYALLEAGDTRISLLKRQSPGEATARISLAFEVADLDGLVARLEAFGTSVSRRNRNDEGLREASTTDPDGNLVRLFSWPRGR